MSDGTMEADPAKRSSAWRILAIFAGAFTLLAGGLVLWIHSTANRRWAQLNKEAHELLDQTLARDPSRPPLRGAALPGNAWDDYNVALAEMRSLSGPSGSLLADYLSRKPKAESSKAEAIVSDHLTALENLRRGASRSSRQYALAWEKGFSADIPGLLQSQRLSQLAACRARLLSEEGKPREAADLLLDTCQFSGDLGHNTVLISEMISMAIYAIAFDELKDLILSEALSREDLLEIGRPLELIDRTFPKMAWAYQNEALMSGFTFLKGDSTDGLFEARGLPVLWQKLRYCGSDRLMLVDAFEVHCRMMNRLAMEGSWSEHLRTSQELQAEATAHRNPIVQMMVPGLLQAERALRERQAHLRLLRVAAHYRATGEVLPVDDPFGTQLRSVQSGKTLKVWSLGRDGVDYGGRGGWKASTGGMNVVLDVDR
jgi:hypothetical protein